MRRVVSRSVLARALLAAGLTFSVPAPHAYAQNLFEFLFGGFKQQQKPPESAANSFADPSAKEQQQTPQQRASIGGGGPGFCVRTCDGKYFPLLRNAASPAQMCQAFCPASVTKVYFGSVIDEAADATGERYADSNTAFAYRKAMKADCTCNGKSPAGLAQVDLTLDTSLRPGDVVATENGLAAYSGPRGGGSLDFTPVASYPGLTAEVRSRLGEMKVAPAIGDQTAIPTPATSVAVATSPTAQANPRVRRALVDANASAR